MINQLIDSGNPFPKDIPDVQATNFSLDAIARFVCNSYQEILDAQKIGNWQFDNIVIGSGMYGSYTASKLFKYNTDSKTPTRTLVLEAGPFLISEHFQNISRVGEFFNLVNKPVVEDNQTFLTQIDRNPSDKLQGYSAHHRCVGGKSLFWGGWSPRLTEEDLNRKESNGNTYWPKEVVDFLNSPDGYAFIEEQIGVFPTADFVNGNFNAALKARIESIITDHAIPALNEVKDAPIAVQAQSPVSGLFSMDKFSSLPLLLSSIREDAEKAKASNPERSLFLVPNAEVIKLEVNRGVVTQIIILLSEPAISGGTPMAQKKVVRLGIKEGANVLLAGNTINSTKLALNSFPKSETSSARMMGKNLMAHVRGNFFWRIHRSALNLESDKSPLENFATAALHIGGTAKIVESKKGNFHFQFYAIGSLKDDPEEYLYRTIPHLDDIQAARQAVLSTNIKDWIVVGSRTCGEMFGNKNADTRSRANSFISVNPFGGGGDDVYFDSEGTRITVPKAFVTLVQTEEDADIRKIQTEAAFDLMAALSGQDRDFVRSRGSNDKIQFIRGGEDQIGSTYHESGTLCMGADPYNSVTDVNGHFHHIANAYCIDQAIFPTVGSANPVPTGLALCQRIVRSINSRYISNPPAPLEDGFISIFDGTLEGWGFYGDGNIQVLPGLNIIQCGTENSDSVLGFIRYEIETFQNFILRLDYKTFSIHANSGIFLRMPDQGSSSFDKLYTDTLEIQIDETGKLFIPSRIGHTIYGSPHHKTGAVYGLAPSSHVASKALSRHGTDGYWNSFEITANNDQIIVRLNGQVVCNSHVPEKFAQPGYIALQCHSEIVQFRNIQLKKL